MSKRSVNKKNQLNKGVQSTVFQPGANQAAVTNTLPEQAISLAAQQGQFNSLQPTQCYELSIPVRACIQAIATNICKAQLRIFDKLTGDEVINGDLVDLFKRPARGWGTSRFLNDIVSFWLISGEIAINLLLDSTKRSVLGMMPLAPPRLRTDGTPVKDVVDIKSWYYTWDNGLIEIITPDSLVFAHNFNPSSHIRGSSLLIAGVNEASCGYFGMKYNKSFYENSSIPSHLLVVSEKLNRKQRMDLEERYFEQFNVFNGKAHKVMVVSGSEKVKIEKLEADQPKDGSFIELMQFSMAQIAALFKVPATEVGLYDKSRFETANVEREMFLENTLLPLMGVVNETFQDQIVDRYYGDSQGMIRGKGLKIGKLLQKSLSSAINAQIGSRYIILLDPDSLPIMAKLQLDRFAAVKSLCDSARMSVNEACDFLGVEIPYSPLRDKIFIPNTYIELKEDAEPEVKPAQEIEPQVDETQQELIQQEETQSAASKSGTGEIETEQEQVEKKLLIRQLNKALRELRKVTLINNTIGKTFRLNQADEILDVKAYPALKVKVRHIHRDLQVRIKGQLMAATRAEIIKSYFNDISKNGNITSLARSLIKN